MTRRLLAIGAACLLAALLVSMAPDGWPWAVAFVAAAAAAILGMPPAAKGASAEGTVRAVLLVPVLLGLLLPAAVGFFGTAHSVLNVLGKGGQSRLWLDLAVVSVALAVLVALARRWPDRLPDWVFLAALTTVLVGLRLAFVLLVEKQPVSDFAGMWRLCNEVSQHGLAVGTAATDHLTRVHFERVLPYLLPMNLLFGPGRLAYVIPNTFLAVGCSWLTYVLAREWLPRPAARTAFALSAVAPETLFATGIPGHDLPGAFYTLVALVAYAGVRRAAAGAGVAKAAAASIGFGLLLLITDVQRTNGIFLLVALALVVAGESVVDLWHRAPGAPRIALRRATFALVLPFLVFQAGDATLQATRLRMSDEMGSLWRSRAIAAHSDSWSPGTQGYAVAHYYRRYPHLDAEQWSTLARRKVLSDLHHNPGEWLSYTVRKSLQLWHLGRQRNFYLRDAHLVPLDRPLSQQALGRAGSLNALFTSVFLVLMLRGLVLTWSRRELVAQALLPAVYLALLGAFLVLLFQPQSRYLFQVWYLGSLYCGVAVASRHVVE